MFGMVDFIVCCWFFPVTVFIFIPLAMLIVRSLGKLILGLFPSKKSPA